MKLSSILSMFMLLAVCSSNISAGGFWDSVRNYFFPKRGSLGDYAHFDQWGECRNCDLRGFNLRPIIEKHKNKEIDLRDADCRGANLSNADLSKAKLASGGFSYTNFKNSNLEGADARLAFFRYANMQNTNMQKANFKFATFMGANLNGSNLKGIKAESAIALNANLSNTNIENANFRHADLAESNFCGAKVNEKTDFEYAICTSTDFRNIDNLDRLKFTKDYLVNCKMGSTSKPNSEHARTMTAIMLGWLGS